MIKGKRIYDSTDSNETKYECGLFDVSYAEFSPAIDRCYENNDGEFLVTNGEYASQVNYCPLCGRKSPKQIRSKTQFKGED